MKKSRSPKSPGASNRRKTAKEPKFRKNDPFAKPPHPLGFNFMSEERPIRASKFDTILPTVIAKYGFGRRLGVERFNAAWRDALTAVFGARNEPRSADGFDDFWADDDFDDGGSSKLATYLEFARPQTFRGGALTVRIASNLLYQELQFYLPALLKEIQAALPDENVERIKLVCR